MLKLLTLSSAALALFAGTAFAQDTQNWDDVVAQAKQEGEVNWYVWYFQDDFRKAVAPFEKIRYQGQHPGRWNRVR
nr:hypothetical protein [Marinicella sp. W31]MDC2878232.1 hypothetical protein [Marinicella sp. W31]